MAKRERRLEPAELEETLSRVAPHSIEAEESLLGAMLLSKEAVAEAFELVGSGDFFKPSHQHVFTAVSSLSSHGIEIDVVTVAEELKKMDVLEYVGGIGTLAAFQASTPAVGSARRYAQLVEEYSLLRKLIRAASEIAEMAYSLPEDVTMAVDLAEAKIFEVAERRSSDSMLPLREVLIRTLDELEALYDKDDAITGTPTGFHDLDVLLSGLHNSNLVIVGARPGMGKTSFALGVSSNVAKSSSLPVLIFSLEMSHLELTQRLVSAESRVDSTKIRNGKLESKDWDKISNAIGRLADTKIFIDDDPNLTVMDIRARARRLKAREGLGLVVVDYLQLMSGSGRRNMESRQVEVSEISRGLKILARELDVPVIALSQLSRNLEGRSDKRPQLADLRESGCLSWDSFIECQRGETHSIASLWATGETGYALPSVDEAGEVVLSLVDRVFMTGLRETFQLITESGLSIRATPNHKFLTRRGWRRLDELVPFVDEVCRVVRPRGDQKRALLPLLPLPAASERDQQEGTVLIDGDVESLPELTYEKVSSISSFAIEPTFDVSVGATHNFIANGLVVHNSLEQDADVVIFIYRDEIYTPDTSDKGVAEIHVAKHRSGPTGTAYLAFLNHCTLFANMAKV